MDEKKVKNALAKAKSEAKKRSFKQSVDLIIVLRDLDLKKPDQQLDFYASTSHSLGKKARIAAFVGPEMRDEAKKAVDLVITPDEFAQYADKKKAKKLAAGYDYFIAQADIMTKVAQSFGKILGTRGKMPNPKAGCVVPPKTNLAPLYSRLQKTVRLKAKTLLAVQCVVGKEDQDEDEVVDNILNIYRQVQGHLPNHENNISRVLVKTTMGKVVAVQ